MDYQQMDRLMMAAVKQGFRVRNVKGGYRVFHIGNVSIVVSAVPVTREEWRILLTALTAAGLVWPADGGDS